MFVYLFQFWHFIKRQKIASIVDLGKKKLTHISKLSGSSYVKPVNFVVESEKRSTKFSDTVWCASVQTQM